MTERLIPEIMKAPAPGAETAAAEEARVQNTIENACPICRKPYTLTEANGIPVQVCSDHAVVMPLKDL